MTKIYLTNLNKNSTKAFLNPNLENFYSKNHSNKSLHLQKISYKRKRSMFDIEEEEDLIL